MQALVLRTVLNNALNRNTEKLLQDHLTFIPDLADFANLDLSVLKAKFRDNISPLITIASNTGSEVLFKSQIKKPGDYFITSCLA